MTRRTLIASSLGAAFVARSSPPALVLRNVNVVDGNSSRRDQTVVIQGGRIHAIGLAPQTPLPPRARVIEGRGRYLLPGLHDMHVHLSVSGPSALPVLLANGVTAVRDMGGLLAELDPWRLAVENDSKPGPRIYRAGPMLNGKAFNQYQFPVENASEARGAVRALHKAGVDFIKVHAAIGKDAWSGVASETKQLGIKFAGHLPRVLTPGEASEGGQCSLEHISTFFDGVLARGHQPSDLPEIVRRFARDEAPALFGRMARNGTAVTPSLVIERASLDLMLDRPSLHNVYLSASARAMSEMVRTKYKAQITPQWREQASRQLEANLTLIPVMVREGVPILSGTDMGSTLVHPGFSLHEELALLCQAGLSSREAVKAATLSCARILGRANAGAVEQGHAADLLLLDADPIADIRNVTKLRALIFGGKYYDRTELDGLLRIARKEAQRTVEP